MDNTECVVSVKCDIGFEGEISFVLIVEHEGHAVQKWEDTQQRGSSSLEII